jgi:hypothetical protein
VLYVRGIVRKIEGRFRLAFAHWGIVLHPEHVRERGEYQNYFSSLLRSRAPGSSIHSRTWDLSPATPKPDLKGSSATRISSSAALRQH